MNKIIKLHGYTFSILPSSRNGYEGILIVQTSLEKDDSALFHNSVKEIGNMLRGNGYSPCFTKEELGVKGLIHFTFVRDVELDYYDSEKVEVYQPELI